MEFTGCVLLALSMSMDALGIGISYGVRGIKVPLASRAVICLMSVAITGAAVFLGGAITSLLTPFAARLIGSLMLALLGGFIICQAFIKKKEKKEKRCGTLARVFIKPLGITVSIVRDPCVCDFNKTGSIDLAESVYLGVALSIDSFGVGVSSAVSGLNSMIIPFAAGLCQLCLLCMGDAVGAKLKKTQWGESKIWNIISGALLVCIAFVRAVI